METYARPIANNLVQNELAAADLLPDRWVVSDGG